MTATNFKDLWQSQNAVETNPHEIIAKAKKLQAITRRKIIIVNITLFLTMVFIIGIVLYYQPKMLLTKIGTLLVVIGIVMHIIATAKLIPLTRKSDAATNNADYLRQMLLIKKKQAFLNTTIINLYFVLLCVGIFMYMFEYALRMTLFWAIFYYAVTAFWFGFSWFYLSKRTIRKQQLQINTVIENLEKINTQFDDEK